MIDDKKEKLLHHRSTLGEELTKDEQARLEAWYKAQDVVEAKILHHEPLQVDLELLQIQVEETFNQLTTVTEQIQQTTKENNGIRQEITYLRQQLGQKIQPA